jgi:hypothetical protein
MTTELSGLEMKWLHRLADEALAEATGAQHALLLGARDKLARMIAERAGVRGWGDLVFRLVLPFYKIGAPYVAKKGKHKGEVVEPRMVLAPRLNEYGSLAPWQRVQLYKELDVRIMAEMGKWPRCRLMGERRPRAVRVTRYSSAMLDECTVDVIGGKVPVDRMVHAGILAGDTPALLVREARWQMAPPGKGQLLVEVHDLL